MTDTELVVLAKELWGVVPLVQGHGIPDTWLRLAKGGNLLGAPIGGERTTLSGKYIYQVFTGGSLWCEVGVWDVKEGLPPF